MQVKRRNSGGTQEEAWVKGWTSKGMSEKAFSFQHGTPEWRCLYHMWSSWGKDTELWTH